MAVALTLCTNAAHAATIASPAPEATAITLYRSDSRALQSLDGWQKQQALERGLIMVTETRTVDLPAGRHTLRFDGVAEGLIPQSAAIEGLPGPAVERNYDYALLSPGTLIERSLDKPVKVVRTNRRTGRQQTVDATLVQGPAGLMVRTNEGVEALGCSGGPERLVLGRAPDGLTDRPSLSTVVDVPQPTRATLKVSYLALGVTWQADYVARIRADGKTLDLTGWLTLVNSGGSRFIDAPTQAVAGRLSRQTYVAPRGQAKAVRRNCWPMDTTHFSKVAEPAYAGAPAMMAMAPPPPPPPPTMPGPPAQAEVTVTASKRMAEQSDLGDYKLYTLPEPVTLNPRQTKQVAFLDQEGVAFQRLYVASVNLWDRYGEDDAPAPLAVTLRLENKTAKGLGKALPAGALAVMETSGGSPAFAGEQSVRDVPVGESLDLVIGQAMDVQAKPRLVEQVSMASGKSKGKLRHTYEVELTNAKSVPITVEVRQNPNAPFFKVLSEPQRHDIQQGQVAWRVPLAAGERRTFRYAVEYGG